MKSLLIGLIGVFFILAIGVDAQSLGDETVVDRFLRYVKIDTQSKDDVEEIPSTKKQFDLANLLAKELTALGLTDVRVDEHAYVYATLPSNLPPEKSIKVPVIGLISHMDTSPDVSGTNVNPILHKNYQGGNIFLPNDSTQILTVEKNPLLPDYIGSTILTADGTTLLGADDKAGIAEIMTALQTIVKSSNIKHGTLKICFTPDEEVARGPEKFDLKGFGAKYAYTIDGEELGEINTETWNANTATITFQGKNTHPGKAKGIMVNSVYAMGDFISRFPEDMRPETTEKRVGFLHPNEGKINVEQSSLKVLIRDFELAGLEKKEKIVRAMAAETEKNFPGVRIDMMIREEYRNMRLELDKYPEVTESAMEACRRAGVEPKLVPVRGGTDGAQLTFMGLPTPNIFTGGQNFHGKLEWIPVRAMEKTVEAILQLVQIWVEKSL